MESSLGRLADAASRRRVPVLAVWLGLLAGGGWFSLQQTDQLSGGGWDVPGSQSVRAGDLLDEFPGHDGVRFGVLVDARTRERATAALARVQSGLSRFPAARIGGVQYFEGGRAVLVTLLYRSGTEDAIDVATKLRGALVSDASGARTRVIGEPAIWSNFQDVSKTQLAEGEAIGVPLALAILLVAFGTLVAALMPIVLGLAAVFLTGAVIYGLATATEMSVYVTNMASMLGIGVAVDYSLFVVSRYRGLLRRGVQPDAALRDALASSGTAVVFSGATVVVSLGSLFLVDVRAMRSMAAGAIVVVTIAVLGTITLLPALLALAGPRIDRLRVRIPRRSVGDRRDLWLTWSERVMRRPVVALGLGAAFMLLLAAPTVALHTENHGLAQLPKDSEVRGATARAAELAGPGFFAPIHVITDDAGAAARAGRRLSSLPGIARVERPVPSAAGTRFLVEAVMSVDPDSRAARTVYREASSVARATAASNGAHVVVGGGTAFSVDIEKALTGGLWKIVLFILAFSYVVLLVFLQSVLLPLKAVFMNLLSVGAAYGVLVAVFQWGWLDWTGYDSPGYLDTIVPTLVLAVTFGLSMDYEVFLLTRIRERYAAGVGNERAVGEGLAASARVITAAALIMVAVFAAFAIAAAPSLKELGVGLAVAIGLDATVVRLVIVPATMRLLGDWNWWPSSTKMLAHFRRLGLAERQ
jgi:uncharacterized membrane protein YdfJ with MMPL/SSD domain